MSSNQPALDPFASITGAYSGAVYDVLRAMGYPNQALPNTLMPMTRDMKVCGPIYTVEGHPDPEIGAHESLLQWTAMLSKAPSDHVVMCQPNDSVIRDGWDPQKAYIEYGKF